jgi:hypothetical protein
MSISGLGSFNSYFPSAPTGGASGQSAPSAGPSAGPDAAALPSSGSSNSAYQFLANFLKESPAKQMEDLWLAKHHLTEQQLEAMPPAQQDAIKKQMADDIKKKLQEQSGGANGTAANIVV